MGILIPLTNKDLPFARKLAKITHQQVVKPRWWKFFNNEYEVQIEDIKNQPIFIVCNQLMLPNKIMQIALLQQAINKKATLICPYLPYSRQSNPYDKGFQVFTKLLSTSNITKIITVDIHSPNVVSICQKYGITLYNITVDQIFSEHIKTLNVEIIIAPDNGAKQRAQAIATALNKPLTIANKIRLNNQVSISLPKTIQESTNAIIVDDIIDTGKTINTLISQLDVNIHIVATHAVFACKPQYNVIFNAKTIALSNSLPIKGSKLNLKKTLTTICSVEFSIANKILQQVYEEQ